MPVEAAGRMITPALTPAFLARVEQSLARADADLATRYPGDSGNRQPVHTVYVSAADATSTTPQDWGTAALQLLDAHAADPAAAAEVTGLGSTVDSSVYQRVRDKLAAQPVEDLRLDFEDGYGHRPDAEEDAAAAAAGKLLRTLLAASGGPAFAGIRFKCLEPATRRRGLRTLDIVVAAVLDGGSTLPDGFTLTLPKVTSVDQVRAMVDVCAALEQAHHLQPGALRFEIQVETPQSILAADGTATVAVGSPGTELEFAL